MNYLTISYRYTYICTPFDKVVGEQQIGGAYVPLFFVKLVIFVIMKINYTYLGIGILSWC